METIWKEVKGFEGLYQISNTGLVKSKKCILVQNIGTTGYYYVKLYKNNKAHTRKIHRLLCEVFMDYIPNIKTSVINHIDENKLNNDLSNLEIVSARYNNSYSKDKTKTTSKYTGVWYRKDRKAWIPQIKINGKSIKLGYCKSEIEASILYNNAVKQIELEWKH